MGGVQSVAAFLYAAWSGISSFPVRSSQEQARQVPAAGRSTYLPNTYGLELEGTYGIRYHRGGQMNWPLFPGSMLRRPANFSVIYVGTYRPYLIRTLTLPWTSGAGKYPPHTDTATATAFT